MKILSITTYTFIFLATFGVSAQTDFDLNTFLNHVPNQSNATYTGSGGTSAGADINRVQQNKGTTGTTQGKTLKTYQVKDGSGMVQIEISGANPGFKHDFSAFDPGGAMNRIRQHNRPDIYDPALVVRAPLPSVQYSNSQGSVNGASGQAQIPNPPSQGDLQSDLCAGLNSQGEILAQVYSECAAVISANNTCIQVGGQFLDALLLNQDLHNTIQAEIAKHGANAIAKTAAAAISADHERKIRKQRRKLERLEDEINNIDVFEGAEVVEAEFCQVNPTDPRCTGLNGAIPNQQNFAGGLNIGFGGGGSTTVGSGNGNGNNGNNNNATGGSGSTAGPKTTVAGALIGDAANINSANDFLPGSASRGARLQRAQARSLAGGGGGAGGAGAPAPSGGRGGGGAVDNSPILDTRFKYSDATLSGFRGKFTNRKKDGDNPFSKLFNKNGAGGGKVMNFKRNPAAFSPKNKLIWDTISSAYQNQVKQGDLPSFQSQIGDQ